MPTESRLAIVGYGKMGKLVERLAPEYGFAVALKLDEYNNADFEGLTAGNFRGVDVAVDFSVPSAVRRNAEGIAALGVNLVIGTTGWLEHLDAVKQAAARLLASQPEYGSWAWEIHHSTKKDAPSGTLLKLVEEMKRAGYSRTVSTASNRAGAHPGTHEIGFDSSADTITLRHTARSREGFARGALQAAQWVVGKRGFHEFGEVLFGG
ncbi:MAG: dihydrodipicolinate reductase C-terminal domain-containing protein [Bryobacteraceae bacterium]